MERFIAVGGGSRSDLWRGIIANVTGKPVYRADAPEATALGAAALAAAGAGLFASPMAAGQAMTHIEGHPVLPDPASEEIYHRLYEDVYRHLFPAVRASMDRLADLTVGENGED